MEHAYLWLKFGTAAAIVVFAGLKLTRDAERLASALGWGHAFAGFVILGWATSLPEMTISISAVTAVQSAALSAGNITGSVIFNLGILALLDGIVQSHRIRDGSHIQGVIPLGTFNLLMLGGLCFAVFFPGIFEGNGRWTVAVGLLALYGAATFNGWWSERSKGEGAHAVLPHHADPPADGSAPAPVPTRILVLRCLAAAGVILGTGIWLTHLGEAVATTYDLEDGFVGSLFLAITSSLPEMVTGYAAVRLGLHVMAAGSILGSNIFNLAILGGCDLLWINGPGAGVPLVEAAALAEPGRMERNLSFALAMTVVAVVARLRQRNRADHQPSRALALVSLVLYAVVMGMA